MCGILDTFGEIASTFLLLLFLCMRHPMPLLGHNSLGDGTPLWKSSPQSLQKTQELFGILPQGISERNRSDEKWVAAWKRT